MSLSRLTDVPNAKRIAVDRPLLLSIAVSYAVCDALVTWAFQFVNVVSYESPEIAVAIAQTTMAKYLLSQIVLPLFLLISAVALWQRQKWGYIWYQDLLLTQAFLVLWEVFYHPDILASDQFRLQAGPHFVFSLLIVAILFQSKVTHWMGFASQGHAVLVRFIFWTGLLLSCGLALVLN